MSTGSSGAFGNTPNDQSTMQEVAGQTREKVQELAGEARMARSSSSASCSDRNDSASHRRARPGALVSRGSSKPD